MGILIIVDFIIFFLCFCILYKIYIFIKNIKVIKCLNVYIYIKYIVIIFLKKEKKNFIDYFGIMDSKVIKNIEVIKCFNNIIN